MVQVEFQGEGGVRIVRLGEGQDDPPGNAQRPGQMKFLDRVGQDAQTGVPLESLRRIRASCSRSGPARARPCLRRPIFMVAPPRRLPAQPQGPSSSYLVQDSLR